MIGNIILPFSKTFKAIIKGKLLYNNIVSASCLDKSSATVPHMEGSVAAGSEYVAVSHKRES